MSSLTFADLLREGSAQLAKTSSSARLDAELLLMFVSGQSRAAVLAHPEREVSDQTAGQYRALLRRRAHHEPLAYLTGQREFFSRSFEVGPGVLIPRPETELLVERALKICEQMGPGLKIADLGTGSGCIAVTLTCELKKRAIAAAVCATDLSRQALAIAARNADQLGAAEQITFLESNWFSAFDEDTVLDLIVSNPPYLRDDAEDIDPELKFEPQAALFAGQSGLDAVIEILDQAPAFLKPSGVLMIEIDPRQAAQVEKLAVVHDQSKWKRKSLVFHKDLSRRERFLEIERS